MTSGRKHAPVVTNSSMLTYQYGEPEVELIHTKNVK
jgi:hypothetical protein